MEISLVDLRPWFEGDDSNREKGSGSDRLEPAALGFLMLVNRDEP